MSFATIVMIAALVLGSTGCASLPKDRVASPSSTLQDTEDTVLSKAIAPLLAEHPGESGFHFLVLGPDALAARLSLIETAERSLDVQYYIWHDDLTGRYLHNRLLAAGDRGVRVRLLLDDFNTAGKDPILRALNAHPNIEVRLYNPFKNRGMRSADFLTNPSRINHRMHNKALIADNHAVILGGRNIGDDYFGASEDVAFGDLDVLAVGMVVQDASSTFDRYWNTTSVYGLSAFYPHDADSEKELAAFRERSAVYKAEAEQSAFSESLKTTWFPHDRNISKLPFVWSHWVLVSDDPEKLKARNVTRDTHLAPQLKEAFDLVQKDLIVISPYFVPGDAVTQYMVDMVASGKRVRILTNSLSANDVPLVHSGYMRYRKDLIKGGVELFEYKAQYKEMEEHRKEAGWGSSHASLHAKSFAFDETHIFVGSFNLDPRSIELNTEFGVYFKSPEYAASFSRAFDANIETAAYKVGLVDGRLTWTTVQDGRTVQFDREPEASWWKRFTARLFRIFVPERFL